VLVGRLPGNTLCGSSVSSASALEALRLEFGARFRLGLAEHERFGLREAVGQQDGVMFAGRVVVEPQREFVETRRVVAEHLAHVLWLDGGMVRLECLPGRGGGQF